MYTLKRKDLLVTEAYVAGKWVQGRSTFRVNNPFDGQEIAQVADLGIEECHLQAEVDEGGRQVAAISIGTIVGQ